MSHVSPDDRSLKNAIVYYSRDSWAAVPANNGANGPLWQWGEELLVGFTVGTFHKAETGHQCTNDRPFASWLARSTDGGESWNAWKPEGYAGKLNTGRAAPPPGNLDFTGQGFVMRVEGAGYHGNQEARWFGSEDRGASWRGPFHFGDLLSHPELAGKQFTARTAYIINGPRELFLFLTVREPDAQENAVVFREKTFLAETGDGGKTFSFLSWVVPWDDAHRGAMPAPVRLSPSRIVVTLRRKSPVHNWIDCFLSEDNGGSWSFLSRVTDTEAASDYNGNPSALVRMREGRLCCAYGNRSGRCIAVRYSEDEGRTWGRPQVLRDDFQSANGFPDLGYPRLFQRPDGKLVTAYFWCSPEKPETHIAATLFSPPF